MTLGARGGGHYRVDKGEKKVISFKEHQSGLLVPGALQSLGGP